MAGLNLGIDIDGKGALNAIDAIEQKLLKLGDATSKLKLGESVEGIQEQFDEMSKISQVCESAMSSLRKEVSRFETNQLKASFSEDAEAMEKWGLKASESSERLERMEELYGRITDTLANLRDVMPSNASDGVKQTIVSGDEVVDISEAVDKTKELKNATEELAQSNNSSNAITEEMAEIRESLADTEAKIEEFKESIAWLENASHYGDGFDGMTNGEIQKALAETTEELRKAEKEAEGYRDRLGEIAKTGNPFSAMSLSELQKEYARTKDELKDLARTMIEQKNEIAQRTKDLADSEKAGHTLATEGIQEEMDILNELKQKYAETQEAYDAAEQRRLSLQEVMQGAPSLTPTSTSSDTTSPTDNAPSSELTAQFQAQREAVDATAESVNNLQNASADYVGQAQLAKEEVRSLTEAYLDNKNSMSDSEQTQALDLINSKISEYGNAVVNASASAQAAYNTQAEAINSLQSSIEELEEKKLEAAQSGDGDSVAAYQQQIDSLQGSLDNAKENLASLAEQCTSTSEAFDSLKETQEGMAEAAENGNKYVEKIKEALSGVKEALSGVKDTAGEVTGAMTNFFTDNGKFQEQLGNLKTAMNGLPIPMGNVLTSIRLMTAAMRKMAATPLGAVITAIVLGLQAMHQWFNRTAEGQKAFAGVSAYLGSLLSSLADIVSILGKYIYNAFAQANGPMHSFAKTVKSVIVGAFSSVKDVVVGFGRTLSGIWHLSPKEIADGITQFAKGIGEAVGTVFNGIKANVEGITGVTKMVYGALTDDKLYDSIADKFRNIGATANQAKDIAMQQIDAEQQLREAKAHSAQMDIEIANERSKIYQLEGKERLEQIRKVKELQKAKMNGWKDEQGIDHKGELDVQRDLLKLQQDKNNLHDSSIQDLNKEKTLRTQLYQMEARHAASTRMMDRLEASTLKQVKNQGKKDAKQGNKIAEAVINAEELNDKNAQDREKAREELEQRIAETTIAAMREGAEKVRAEKKQQLKKELDDIIKERDAKIKAEVDRLEKEHEATEKIIKAQGGKATKFDRAAAQNDSAEVAQIVAAYETIANNVRQQQRNDTEKAEREAMQSYLASYGDLQEKKLAIARQYEEKIAHATTEGERMSLQRQMEKALSDIDFEKFKKEINWEAVFNDLENQTKEQLETLRDQLREALNDDSLNIEQYKVIATQIGKITDAISNEEAKEKAFLGWELPKLREKIRLRNELENAKDVETKAQENVAKKTALLGGEKDLIADRLAEMGIKYDGEIKGANADDILSVAKDKGFDESTTDYAILQQAMENLAKSETELEDANKKLTKATTDREGADKKYTKFTDNLKNKVALFAETFEKVNQNIQSLDELGAELGIDKDSKLGQKIGNVQDAANNTLGAAKDFMSGNYVGAAAKALSAVGNIGDLLGVGGESDKTYAEDMERISQTNSILTKSMDALSEKMDDSNLIDALKIHSQQQDNYEKIQENMKEQLRRSGGSYNSGKWGTGIGGEHSTDYFINKGMSTSDWNEISRATGKMVRSAYDLWSLDSKEMADISTKATTQWIKLMQLADDGHQDLTEYLNEYIEIYKKMDREDEKIREKATSISFDGLKSQFLSALQDMNHSSADFANDFEELMKNAMLNAMLTEYFEDDLKKWYEEFYDAMKDDGRLSRNEQERLREEYTKISDKIQSEREALYDTMGWSNTGSQSASQKSFASMSEDTGQELNGRFTALQIAGESINENITVAVSEMMRLSSFAETAVGQRADILLGVNRANGFLEDVVKYNKQLRDDVATIVSKVDSGIKML